MGVNFELDLRADAFLKRYQHHVNAEFNRQYGSLREDWRT